MRKFWCIIFCSNLAYSQTQIYFPQVSNKEHERALITLPNRQMPVAQAN